MRAPPLVAISVTLGAALAALACGGSATHTEPAPAALPALRSPEGVLVDAFDEAADRPRVVVAFSPT